ncbi:hypothetical protein ACU4GI_32940 [Cupriavidus basilensis]
MQNSFTGAGTTGAASTSDSGLFDWPHVAKENRPVDTNRRTPAGHRIIYNTQARTETVEYPFDSGALFSPEAYETRLAAGVQEAAPKLLASLQAILAKYGYKNPALRDDTETAARATIAQALGL